MILIDTDILIWNLRGNERAADLLDQNPGFCISAVTYMELVQGLRDKAEFRRLRQAMHFWECAILQITEGVSARACYLMETHTLGDGLQVADALIAGTALESGLVLSTGNAKHYKEIDGLTLRTFRP